MHSLIHSGMPLIQAVQARPAQLVFHDVPEVLQGLERRLVSRLSPRVVEGEPGAKAEFRQRLSQASHMSALATVSASRPTSQTFENALARVFCRQSLAAGDDGKFRSPAVPSSPA